MRIFLPPGAHCRDLRLLLETNALSNEAFLASKPSTRNASAPIRRSRILKKIDTALTRGHGKASADRHLPTFAVKRPRKKQANAPALSANKSRALGIAHGCCPQTVLNPGLSRAIVSPWMTSPAPTLTSPCSPTRCSRGATI
jgi:hypothetical protein